MSNLAVLPPSPISDLFSQSILSLSDGISNKTSNIHHSSVQRMRIKSYWPAQWQSLGPGFKVMSSTLLLRRFEKFTSLTVCSVSPSFDLKIFSQKTSMLSLTMVLTFGICLFVFERNETSPKIGSSRCARFVIVILCKTLQYFAIICNT